MGEMGDPTNFCRVMTIMSKSSETRWYEPPPPRDWKTNPSVLQRIESAENLRKSLLESAAKATGAIPLRKSFQPDPIDMYGRSRSMASLPSTPPAFGGSISGSPSYGHGLEDNRIVQPGFTKEKSGAMGGSVNNINNSTFVVRNKIKPHGQAERVMVKTPPSRPRTSTLTKFRPLPAIKHSAGSSRSDPSSADVQYRPPPLLRSKTFDVIETNLQSLPVVSDVESSFSDSSDDDASDISVTSADKDRSSVDASDSGVVSANSKKAIKGTNNRRETIFDRGNISSAVPVQTVTVMIEGKLISEYVSQNKLGATRSRPCTQYGKDHGRNDSAASYGSSDNSADGSDSDSSASGESDDKEDEEHTTSPDVSSEPIINNVNKLEEDMIIYVKMPDDTLMLASCPRDRTLRELLGIVKETNINGNCVIISRKGLTVNDLDKSLYELGIHDNTTLHLLSE